MSWGEVFLGVIAGSTLVMALVLVAAVVYGWTMARRIDKLVARFEEDLKPLIDSANAIGRDISRATGLAATQFERFDQLLTNLSARVEQTAATVQSAVIAPIREGSAAIAGLRTALAVLKEITRKRAEGPSRADDDDPLFIG